MKKIYWDFITINEQNIYFTVNDFGLNFVADPNQKISTIFDFYPKMKWEFRFDSKVTKDYRSALIDCFMNSSQFKSLPIDINATGSPLQQKIWQLISQIQPGQRLSLTDLMHQLKIGNQDIVKTALQVCPVWIVLPLQMVGDTDHVWRGNADLNRELRLNTNEE